MRKVRNKNGVVPIGSGTTQSDSKLLNVVKYMMSKYSSIWDVKLKSADRFCEES